MKIISVKSFNQIKSVIKTMYDIVKVHGGEIKVSTKVNEGTTFTVSIPLS